jgi:hypothetical protein
VVVAALPTMIREMTILMVMVKAMVQTTRVTMD